MSFIFQAEANLKFKSISADLTKRHVDNISNARKKFDILLSFQVEINSLDDNEKKLLFEDGCFTPDYVSYWTKLIFEVQKHSHISGISSYWVDTASKQYYDGDVRTTLELMTDSLRWENNKSNLFFVWGNINPAHIFDGVLHCDGILMPCLEGWGIIALIDLDSSLLLNNFLPMSPIIR